MTDAAVDWSSVLSDLGVPGVPGVPAQKSATFDGTPSETLGVLGVPEGRAEHLGTPLEHLQTPATLLISLEEHLGTPGTPGFVGGGVPEKIQAGLHELRVMRTPRVQYPELWAGIVNDAWRIAAEGWATQALSLGWDAYSLWGVEPSRHPDTWDYSLAVVLAGRSIRAVDEQRFYLRDGEVRCFFEKRPRTSLTQFLWELGR